MFAVGHDDLTRNDLDGAYRFSQPGLESLLAALDLDDKPPTAKPNKGEITFGELEAYQNREVLRYLEGLQTRESANTAAWLESLKSHRGYQAAILKDPDWIRIKAEGQEAIEQYKQGRAAFKGRQWDDLTEAEKAKCEELDAELHKRLFPLQQAMLKLRQGYGIPSAPGQATTNTGAALPPTAIPKQSQVNGGAGSTPGQRTQTIAPCPYSGIGVVSIGTSHSESLPGHISTLRAWLKNDLKTAKPMTGCETWY